MKKTIYIIITLLIIALIGGGVYWFFFMQTGIPDTTNDEGTSKSNIFNPFKRNTVTPSPVQTTQQSTSTVDDIVDEFVPTKIPALRKLSSAPVGGMAASTTASSTIVRFIDRGVGHISEARDTSNTIDKISNTTIPKVYDSFWNKNLTALVLRYLKEDSETVVNFYAELRQTGTSTATSTSITPYELKGKYLSADIQEIAVSPLKDKIFTWNIENGKGVGYISSFDEKTKIKIFETPITEALVEWPEISKIFVTTKASAYATGHVYTVDTKTGTFKKVFGGPRGLATKASKDLSKLLYSQGTQDSILLSLLNLKDNKSQNLLIRTLADKCVWSSYHKEDIYCAVPTEIPQGIYPDDWYRGTVSFVDEIWHIDSTTGEVHLLAKLLSAGDALIDATNLTLDDKDNYLYFINKRDLSLWSLDLNN